MISEENFDTLAKRYQTSIGNIRREYFQHLFLSYFYGRKQSVNIFFKGGTALRIIYRSPRFSEDLDFSVNQSSLKNIEDIVIGALVDIEREGIRISLEEAKETSGGYLAKMIFRSGSLSETIKLEISSRSKKDKGELTTIDNDYIPAYTIFSLSRKQLIGGKIEALINRKKARDFYDLYFILRANLLPPEERGALAKVPEILKKTRINFRAELRQFLPQSHWPIIKELPKALEREIRRFL